MKRNLNRLERIMLAVTFAESNCPEMARGYLTESGFGYDSVQVADRGLNGAEGNRCR